MDKLQPLSLVAALALTSACFAQSSSTTSSQSQTTQPSGSSQSTTQQDRDRTGSSTSSSGTQEGGSWSSSSSRGSGTMTSSQQGQKMSGMHRVSQLIGTSVTTSGGEDLGEVRDVIVDTSGKATHVIVSYGGAMGIGSKMVAVPWKSAHSMMKGDSIVMDRTRLQSAPSFTDSTMPNFSSTTWSREADRYWGSTRSAAGSSSGMDSSSSMGTSGSGTGSSGMGSSSGTGSSGTGTSGTGTSSGTGTTTTTDDRG